MEKTINEFYVVMQRNTDKQLKIVKEYLDIKVESVIETNTVTTEMIKEISEMGVKSEINTKASTVFKFDYEELQIELRDNEIEITFEIHAMKNYK